MDQFLNPELCLDLLHAKPNRGLKVNNLVNVLVIYILNENLSGCCLFIRLFSDPEKVVKEVWEVNLKELQFQDKMAKI